MIILLPGVVFGVVAVLVLVRVTDVTVVEEVVCITGRVVFVYCGVVPGWSLTKKLIKRGLFQIKLQLTDMILWH